MNKAFIQRLRYGVLALMVAGVCSSPLSVHADDFDDDLYYSPAKAEKQKKKEEEARRAAALKAQKDYEGRLARYDSITAAYDAAHPMQGLDVNEDSYNRHGSFLVGESRGDSTLLGGMPVGDFAYTRRIERFHNDSIVSQSSDEELQDYYYATAAQQADPTIVNIYVNNPYAFGGYPYYGYPTYWGDYWGCYGRPYGWNWNWGWSMGWNIGWHDPWFDFGWGPSWGWS
ncbi:MAG: hypothetical protein K2M06_03195, partial [Muribaculaceae bacterium]|nr:hypothetical protein [Muribaculaceae bacterium]